MSGFEPLMPVTVDGIERKMTRSFWRGEHTRFRPLAEGMQKPDALIRHILAGWMPSEPFIDRDTTVVAFGSCFAQHISGYLNSLGFGGQGRSGKAYVTEMGEGIVNTFAIRQQFEWAWLGRTPEVPLWHGYRAEEFGYDEDVRLATRALFDGAEVFILTLGLSEIWYDEPTGEVFWRAVPTERFDPARHKFRVATAAENKANLTATCDLIRAHRPDAAIIFTLSPIPLSATFRPISSFTADAASKASLKCALDEVMQERAADPRLFYYPSYEVVLGCFCHPFQSDLRHPYNHVLDLNMRAFERFFCRTGLDDEDVGLVYLEALAADRDVALTYASGTKRLGAKLTEWRNAHPAASLRRETLIQERRDAIARRDLERETRMADRAARVAEREARIAAREARLAARGRSPD